jgi:predicted DNA-binding transcriptional regulator AlpA
MERCTVTTAPKKSRIVRTKAAAERLGISESWLAKRSMAGKPPAFLKLGRAVGYEEHELDALAEASRRQSTSDIEH